MNDERPIEKLLRRYARKRREEAGEPLELHPATRRLLQGEIARQLGQAGAKESSSIGWLALLRAKWVYATAAAGVVVAVGLVVFNPRPNGVTELAGRKDAPVEAPALRPGGELATELDRAPFSDSATPTEAAKKDRAEETRRPLPASQPADAEALAASPVQTKPPVPAPAPVVVSSLGDKEVPAPAASGPAGAATSADRRDAVGQRYGLAPAAAPAPSAPARTSMASRPRAPADAPAESSARREANVAVAPTDNFARRYARIVSDGNLETRRQAGQAQAFADLAKIRQGESSELSVASSTPVLRYFEVVQTGDQWQVVDADGSTYTGRVIVPIQTGADDAVKGAAKLKAAAVGAIGSVAPANNNSFRVSGTNRTLNQQVVFTWNFVARTNPASATTTQVLGGTILHQSQIRNPQLPGLYNNQGISGRAQINAGKEFEVRAAPVNP